MDFLNLITFIYQSVWLSQSPFNKSCTNYNHWKNIKAIDNAGIICGVFLDQQEAFDTVDHEILSKLEHFICGVPLKWFKTFLTQWHQYVSIKNSISETLTNDHVTALLNIHKWPTPSYKTCRNTFCGWYKLTLFKQIP